MSVSVSGPGYSADWLCESTSKVDLAPRRWRDHSLQDGKRAMRELGRISSMGGVTPAERRPTGLCRLPRYHSAGAPQLAKQRPGDEASYDKREQGAKQYSGADD